MRIKPEFYLKDKLWLVEFVDGAGMGESSGYTHQEERTIQLWEGLKRKEKDSVFMHEFIHASLFELHLSGPANVLSGDVEEILSTGLSDILLSTFELKWRNR